MALRSRYTQTRGGVMRHCTGRHCIVRFCIATAAQVSMTAALVACVGAQASAQSPKAWRHGIIEAKSDAGILFMASKRDYAGRLGLKLEFVQLKNDTIALKALLAGE